MIPQRIATSVLLTRGDGDRYEVFLARRNAALSFFGGYWAFLGGTVDEIDHDGDPDDDDAHRRCALRELFEEAGLLPGVIAAELEELERAELRGGLIQGGDPSPFRALLDAHPEVLASARPFARLTTPPFAPVLYRTRFVHCAASDGQEPLVVQGELIEGHFAEVEEALERWRRGELLLAPPMVYLLDRMRGRSLEEFLEYAGRSTAELEDGHIQRVRNTPGVLMVPLATDTLPPATTTNTYVVGEERLYVIDPAPEREGEQERLLRLLDECLSEGREIAGVIATHHHADHVGAVAAVSRRYGAAVLAHPLTLERLPEAVEVTRPLCDGDRLELGRAPDGSPDWALEAYHTPGHDRGHLVLVESRYRAAFLGDLASTLSTIVIDPPEGHMATYLASLRRIAELPIGLVYPAHGPAHRQGKVLLEGVLKHRAEREAKLVAALASGVRSREALLARVYDDVPPELTAAAARSLAAGLEKLVEEGRVPSVGG